MSETRSEAPDRLEYHQERDFSLLEETLRDRRIDFVWSVGVVCAILAVALALFHLFVAVYGTPESRTFRSTHLTVMLVLAVLLKPLFRRSVRDPLIGGNRSETMRRLSGLAIDLMLCALAVGIQAYTMWDITAFQEREGDLTQLDIYVGTAMLLLVLEVTRRAVGIPMVCVALFFVLHALFANHFPGFFYGPPMSYVQFIDILFMRSEGIFGIPLYVASTFIVLFIIFGAILIRSGAGALFIDLAVALTGHRTGGPAKASVVASAFLGTVSGSAVSNVVTTGTFTIPLMKQIGFRAKFAGAVEACASSGGQITPPIMGAAAFIIAEFLSVPYLYVLAAATLPTFLYFATLYFMVHIEAEKSGIQRMDRALVPRIGAVLRRGWHQLLTLVVLVTLLVVGYTPMLAAFWAIVTLFALSFVHRETRMSPVDVFAALESGVRSAMPVTVACACAGIIVGSIFASGLGLKFTNSVIAISDGNLFVLLVLTGIAAIVLGMGMTTTAVYITVAALIVPALVKSGIEPMAAHLFAFYFGVVSSITPPVALAAFAAAALAGSKPMETAVESARVGIAKYIAPFIFVYNPSLIFKGPIWLTVLSTLTAVAGLWALSVVLEGWYKGRVPLLPRLLLGGAGLALLVPVTREPFGLVPGYALVALGALGVGMFIFTRAAQGREAHRREAA
jgi:TRAP transporter 4TM/12TM fusion protein